MKVEQKKNQHFITSKVKFKLFHFDTGNQRDFRWTIRLWSECQICSKSLNEIMKCTLASNNSNDFCQAHYFVAHTSHNDNNNYSSNNNNNKKQTEAHRKPIENIPFFRWIDHITFQFTVLIWSGRCCNTNTSLILYVLSTHTHSKFDDLISLKKKEIFLKFIH